MIQGTLMFVTLCVQNSPWMLVRHVYILNGHTKHVLYCIFSIVPIFSMAVSCQAVLTTPSRFGLSAVLNLPPCAAIGRESPPSYSPCLVARQRRGVIWLTTRVTRPKRLKQWTSPRSKCCRPVMTARCVGGCRCW